MEKTVYLILFCLSVLIAALSVGAFAYGCRKVRGSETVLTPLALLTVGIYLSIFILLLPVYLFDADNADSLFGIRSVLMAGYDAIRVFILETDFGYISSALPPEFGGLRTAYLFYLVFLYIFAPVLTFGNVLSVFKNLKGELLLALNKKNPLYIFSTLDDRALAMADSVFEKLKERGERSLIVFTDVFPEDSEENYELRLRADKLGAICLKKDVTNIDLKKKKGKIQIFLMGDDESEILAQAINLTDAYKDSANISIFLFATTPSSGYIMDSFCNSFSLDEETKALIRSDPNGFLDDRTDLSSFYDFNERFFVKRFNSYNLLVQNILCDDKLLAELDRLSAKDKVISLLIVGFGTYGKQIMKAAVWLYQEFGYKLEINVIDGGVGDKNSVLEQFTQQCPDLVNHPVMDEQGEACYDIRYITDIDCFSSKFEDVFFDPEHKERLKRTQAAFVTLGDDERNIRAAMEVRKIFDRLKAEDGEKSDDPHIYSIVYDEKKATNLNVGRDGAVLRNHKNQPYNITFIGNLSSQFSYDRIEAEMQTENKAFVHHLEWVRKARRLRERYVNDPEFARLVNEDCQKRGKPVRWDDSYWYHRKEEYKDATDEELSVLNELEYIDFEGEINAETLIGEAERYLGYEYFRFSSIARSLHKKRMEKKYPCIGDKSVICDCENCDIRRRTEHMRWNAYMRTIGFTYNAKRNDRAKYHNDLVTWDKLSLRERYKD